MFRDSAIVSYHWLQNTDLDFFRTAVPIIRYDSYIVN